ncbi:MAG: response regulator [Rubrivivax sp.]|nr:MAG: response regulator [Rubrivivax sp.]
MTNTFDHDRLPSPPRSNDLEDRRDLDGIHILVVDDNADAADSMAFLLAGFGAAMRVETSGAAALTAMRHWCPDVVLLDLGMPDMSGYQVARVLRSQPELERLVLIALTGYGRQIDRERSTEVGFDHHVTKPVDLDELRRVILGSVSTRRAGQSPSSPSSQDSQYSRR